MTGFHMGLLDPDTLEQADVQALAETVARCALYPSRALCDASWASPHAPGSEVAFLPG